ncbi:hypothetical protein MVES1_003292 [Malassezia vespertilionis]|uniref:J domain-containing protein n=1 Tax=Malassezia vespertilionis TaxID=2020962 RepID=A0A2N1J6X7_9BASI|nr:uncharacterized protein MVES1_003292 [Malassezia vespertilionis]PKI82294.1 hypothetical protein MVES_003800 [Malassezia vespertilionis]WFD07923.1 hypothetical protein MVES1_003292 [Malassezia vespertilionis]
MARQFFWQLALAVYVSIVLICKVTVVHADTAAGHGDWLRKANAALSSYDYVSALEAFDEAIEQDPHSYLTYFRRSTAQQALGRTAAALADLQATISRNPSFAKAYLQEARIHLKEGDFALALDALKRLSKHPDKEAAIDVSQAKELEAQAKHGKDLEKKLSKLAKGGAAKAEECASVASTLLKLAPNHLSARSHRAQCEAERGNLDEAFVDWTRQSALTSSPLLQLRLSLIAYYILGMRDSQMQDAGVRHIKACLHNDPDNKSCIRAYKLLRKIEKALNKARLHMENGKWVATISALKGPKLGAPTILEDVEQVLQQAQKPQPPYDEPLLPATIKNPAEKSELVFEIHSLYCKAYSEQHLFKKAMHFCDKVLARNPDDRIALAAKGEDHLANGRYNEAVQILSRAFELSGNADRDLYQRLAKAQKLLKQSNSKDYYKVLGVARDADERTIKKAYRRLAREHHPDKGGSQEKMAEINEAFGVLNDSELRERYNQGDDPNDPLGSQDQHSQAFHYSGGGHPFSQFFQNDAFHQFAQGQSGQQYHFSF